MLDLKHYGDAILFWQVMQSPYCVWACATAFKYFETMI